MLPHYSPFKVAETFTILAALYPDRIDLGLGRAAGHRSADDVRAAARPPADGAPTTSHSSWRSCSPTSTTRCPKGTRSPAREDTARAGPTLPEPWLLGSSAQSAIWAAQLALPYAFADFINPAGAEIAALYRQRFAEHRERLTAHRGRGLGRVRRHRRGGQHLAASSRMTLRLLRRGTADPGALTREGARVPARRGRPGRPVRLPRRRGIIGSPETGSRRVAGAGRRVRGRRGDRRHDHLRPCGAPALLRAARGGDGAAARAQRHRVRSRERKHGRVEEAVDDDSATPPSGRKRGTARCALISTSIRRASRAVAQPPRDAELLLVVRVLGHPPQLDAALAAGDHREVERELPGKRAVREVQERAGSCRQPVAVALEQLRC